MAAWVYPSTRNETPFFDRHAIRHPMGADAADAGNHIGVVSGDEATVAASIEVLSGWVEKQPAMPKSRSFGRYIEPMDCAASSMIISLCLSAMAELIHLADAAGEWTAMMALVLVMARSTASVDVLVGQDIGKDWRGANMDDGGGGGDEGIG